MIQKSPASVMSHIQQLHILSLRQRTRIDLSSYNALSVWFRYKSNISIFGEMHKSERLTNLKPYYFVCLFVDICLGGRLDQG